MSEPLVVISTFKVKEGKLDDLRKHYQKILDIVEANEPQIIGFYGFLNEDETEMSSIQIHPNTASMDFHMQVLRENWDESFSQYSQMLDGIRIEYYGVLPQSVLEMDVQSEKGSRVTPEIKPVHIAGLMCTSAG